MKDTVDNLLEKHKGQMKLEELPMGHKERFLAKKKRFYSPLKNNMKYWGIAASVILLLSIYGIWRFVPEEHPQKDFVEDMKPKSLLLSEEETMDRVDITKEKLLAKAGENKGMVEGSLIELKRLEEDYQQLENDLAISGNKKVIEAMHKNLELRIDILKKTQEELTKFQKETK